MNTLLLNSATGRKSLNSLYTTLTSEAVLDHIDIFNTNHAAGEPTNNVYKLLILERAVEYLHKTAGFPTKAKRLKTIYNGNYLT